MVCAFAASPAAVRARRPPPHPPPPGKSPMRYRSRTAGMPSDEYTPSPGGKGRSRCTRHGPLQVPLETPRCRRSHVAGRESRAGLGAGVRLGFALLVARRFRPHRPGYPGLRPHLRQPCWACHTVYPQLNPRAAFPGNASMPDPRDPADQGASGLGCPAPCRWPRPGDPGANFIIGRSAYTPRRSATLHLGIPLILVGASSSASRLPRLLRAFYTNPRTAKRFESTHGFIRSICDGSRSFRKPRRCVQTTSPAAFHRHPLRARRH